jgi:hypothetical protein
MPDEVNVNVEAPVENTPAPVVETSTTPGTAADSSMTREEFKSSSSFLKQFQASQEVGTDKKPAEQTAHKESAVADTSSQPSDKTPVTEEEAPKGEVTLATVKLPDGRELTVEQISELEKGSMMQKDYTQKTQSLAEEKRLLQQEREALSTNKEQTDKALQLYTAFERDPIGVIQQLTDYYEKQGIYEPKTPDQLALEDQKRELALKEQAINQKGQTLEQQEQTSKFNQYMDGLATKYQKDGFDKQKVADYMQKNNVYDAEAAWKAMNHDPKVESLQKQINELNEKLKSAKSDSVNEYVKTKIDKSGTPPPLGVSGSGGAPPVQINKPTTLRDAKLSALARMGAS